MCDLLEVSLVELAQDPYGNFAVQKLIEVCKIGLLKICAKLTPQVAQLCLQKYASNVVDKLISHCEFENHLETDHIKLIIQSQYGNLVLQNIVNEAVLNSRNIERVLAKITEAANEIKDPKIQHRWLQLAEKWQSGQVESRIRQERGKSGSLRRQGSQQRSTSNKRMSSPALIQPLQQQIIAQPILIPYVPPPINICNIRSDKVYDPLSPNPY